MRRKIEFAESFPKKANKLLKKNPHLEDVSVRKILNVEEPHAGHFYWPDLDVDLTAEIIEHPERFPLKMK